MCDIGRFEYHWVEGDDRLRRPTIRSEAGVAEPASWHDAFVKLRERLAAVEAAGAPLTFLISAHASHEEMFLVKKLAAAAGGAPVAVSWRTSPKAQPAGTKFKVPAVDAPNVNGARDFGFAVSAAADGSADLRDLRQKIEQGGVQALYVFDPGPPQSLGDVSWIIDARKSGRLPLLIVQGAVKTALTEAADLVMAGASWVEKDASYTNEQGRVQGAARVNPPPGDAMEDWQIFVNVANTIGVSFGYTESAHIRSDIAAEMASRPGYADLARMTFARPVSAAHWLQTSNPSERWKWDFLFQDLPPVKFADEPEPTSAQGVIPLRPVD
jgi:predicted molibdopterin-dependent oxidoreductase YjgC